MKPYCLFLGLIFCTVLSAQPEQSETEKTDKDSTYVVELGAFDYAFALPSEIPSGWITFRMKNNGEDTHVAMIGKRPDSISMAEFQKDIGNGIFPIAEAIGGPGLHSPGHSTETTIYLKPGDYVIGCGANRADGTKHTRLGMIRYFEVLDEPSGATEPDPDAELSLSRYEIEGKLYEEAGRKTLKINHKAYPMDLHLIRLDGNSTLSEVRNYFYDLKDPTQTEFLGGVEQAEPGMVSYVTLDIEPGEYTWMSHEYGTWGMQKPYRVLESGQVLSTGRKLEKSELPVVNIKLGNGKIKTTEDLREGMQLIELTATDSLFHEVFIFRMRPGNDIEDIEEDWVEAGKKWTAYEEKGIIPEFGEASTLGHAYKLDTKEFPQARLKLIPGNYILACSGKDEEGNRHWKSGEFKEFTISASGSETADSAGGE